MGPITNLESSCDVSVLLCIAYSHKLTDLPWLHRLQVYLDLCSAVYAEFDFTQS